MAEIQVVVVTPESTVFDEMADSVVIPLIDGESGVLPGHAPMVGRLGAGELRVHSGSKNDCFFIDGGTVQIVNNVVSVLTGQSVPVSEIDVVAAREDLSQAERLDGTKAESAALKNKALNKARAQIRLAERN